MKNNPAQRILIVGSGTLFDEGLERLLVGGKNRLEILHVIYINDADFLAHFLYQRPDVVVLFEDGPLSVSRVFELVGDIPEVMHLRVITVMTGINVVEIHERQHITAVRGDMLNELIG